MASDGPILIRHALADGSLARLLGRSLISAGLPDHRVVISCWSEDLGGRDELWRTQRSALEDAALIVQLFSLAFMRDPRYLVETGMAWDFPTFPLVVAPLTREEAAAAIGRVQMGRLGDPQEVDDALKKLRSSLEHTLKAPLDSDRWRAATRSFKAGLAGTVPAPGL